MFTDSVLTGARSVTSSAPCFSDSDLTLAPLSATPSSFRRPWTRWRTKLSPGGSLTVNDLSLAFLPAVSLKLSEGWPLASPFSAPLTIPARPVGLAFEPDPDPDPPLCEPPQPATVNGEATVVCIPD